ncbi:MAG: hypothetical protein AAGC70_20080 [Pseudomonadota bacterium]
MVRFSNVVMSVCLAMLLASSPVANDVLRAINASATAAPLTETAQKPGGMGSQGLVSQGSASQDSASQDWAKLTKAVSACQKAVVTQPAEPKCHGGVGYMVAVVRSRAEDRDIDSLDLALDTRIWARLDFESSVHCGHDTPIRDAQQLCRGAPFWQTFQYTTSLLI